MRSSVNRPGGRTAPRISPRRRLHGKMPHGMMTAAIGRASRMSKGTGAGVGDRMTIRGIGLEVLRRGPRSAGGPPVLLLHGMETVHKQARFLDLLGRHGEIIAPSSPRF